MSGLISLFMLCFIIFIFFSCPWLVSGQYLLPAARLIPTGNVVFSQELQEPFSGQANPATVSRIKSSWGLMAEQKFLLHEMRFAGFAAVLSGNHTGIGLYYNHAGDFLNFQQSGGLQLARDLGKVAVGIEISRHQWKTAGYARQVQYTGSAGCLFDLSSKCMIGLTASPVMVPHLSRQDIISIARKFGWGIGYECSDEVLVALVLEKTEGRPVSWRGSVIYKPVESCRLQGGYQSVINLYWFAAGWDFSFGHISFSLSVHPVLGSTPGLQFFHEFSK